MTTVAALIRPATDADLSALLALSVQTMWEAFGPPHNRAEDVAAYIAEAFTAERLAAELADSGSTFLLATDAQDRPVGYAKLRRKLPPRQRPPRQVKGQHGLEIQRLYITQEQIGTGLGRQLMEACQAIARSEGYSLVWLGVWERNQRAIGFYERMGFRRVGWHYFQFGSERQRDYWMSKPLQE